MKKEKLNVRALALLLAFVLVMGFMPLLSVAINEELGENAEEMILYAGQDIEVGTVTVWNDAEYIYVTYHISEENWYLTETHLHIGESLDDFPLAGRWGNPVPGHFDYIGTHEYITEYTYEISLDYIGAESGDELIIAAHAVVVEITIETGTLTPELDWTRSSEEDVSHFEGRGAQWALEQGFDIELDPEELVWDGGTEYQNDLRAGINPDISYATWIYDYADGDSHDGYADLRRFQADFDIPEGYEITSGKLESVNEGYDNQIPINDNIYIFVNEDLLFWGGTIINVEGATEFEGMEGKEAIRGGTVGDRDPLETDGWYIPGTIPDVDVADFFEGENTLDVFAEEFSLWGAMHELVLTLDYEETMIYDETAWAAYEPGEIRFTERGNWATYFEYSVEVEEIECTWTGVWLTEWNPDHYVVDFFGGEKIVEFTQDGNTVTGVEIPSEDEIYYPGYAWFEGEIVDQTLVGTWGHTWFGTFEYLGTFEITMSDDCGSFEGDRYDDPSPPIITPPDTQITTWTGVRQE